MVLVVLLCSAESDDVDLASLADPSSVGVSFDVL